MSELDCRPNGWRYTTIGEIAEGQPGFPCGEHNSTGVGIPHLRPMNVDSLGRIDLRDLRFVDPSRSRLRLQSGDVIFNNTNSPALVGKTAYCGSTLQDVAFSNHMTRLRVKSDIEPQFLAIQLHWLWMQGYFKERCTNHVNQASISTSTLLKSVQIVTPARDEQRRIVKVIEEQFSRLDALETQLRNAKRRTELLEDATFALTLHTKAPMRRLREIAHTSSGGTPSRSKHDNYGGTIPWVKSGELRDSAVRRTDECITELGLRSSSAKIVKRGALLIAMYGATVGKLGVLEIDAATNQAVCAIQPHDPYTMTHLRYCLRALRPQLVRAAKGGAQPNISQGIIRELLIPMPSAEDRERIVASVSAAVEASQRLQAAIERSLKKIARARAVVLREAFNGRLSAGAA